MAYYFIDDRDGNQYKTCHIGKKTWMMENLRYYAGKGTYRYMDDPLSINEYGYLYDASAIQKAIPAGWKLPDDQDFVNLLAELRHKLSTTNPMKALSGALEKEGYSMQLGGYGSDIGCNYWEAGESAYFWSKGTHGYPKLVGSGLMGNYCKVVEPTDLQNLFSLRLVRDDSEQEHTSENGGEKQSHNKPVYKKRHRRHFRKTEGPF